MLYNIRFTGFFAETRLQFHTGLPAGPTNGRSLDRDLPTRRQDMDLQAQLQEIWRTRKRARRRPYRASRLNRHRAGIEKLRKMGASLEEIRLWLRRYRRVRITRRAILYRLRRWEEERSS